MYLTLCTRSIFKNSFDVIPQFLLLFSRTEQYEYQTLYSVFALVCKIAEIIDRRLRPFIDFEWSSTFRRF